MARFVLKLSDNAVPLHGDSMTVSQPTTLGRNLRRLRGRLGLTQEEVAQRAHLSRVAVTAIESGLVTNPQAQTLARLADALGVDIASLGEPAAPSAHTDDDQPASPGDTRDGAIPISRVEPPPPA